MNKKKLYHSLEQLQRLLSEKSIPLVHEAIDLFAPVIEAFRINSNGLLDEGNTGQQRRREITNQIQQIIRSEKQLKYRKVIVQSSKLEEGLEKIREALGYEHSFYTNFLEELSEKLETFLANYESYARSYSVQTSLSMSLSASELKTSITSTKQILGGVLLLSESDSESDLPRLELYLSNVKTLKEFSVKLDALSEIYLELLHLYGKTEGDFPVLIEHLESGSLWIKIAGHTLTATILTSILTTATEYYQSEFTKTGQLNQLPTSVKVADDLLRISDQLEKDGIDTSEIKDNIASATRKISKNLDLLLGDQPTVHINNNEKNLSDALKDKLIEQSKDFKLEHSTTQKKTNNQDAEDKES